MTASADAAALPTGVEQPLAALAEALRSADADAIAAAVTPLQQALAAAPSRGGDATPWHRLRLIAAARQVAALREAVARAAAVNERRLDLLLPQAAAPGPYAAGHAPRALHALLRA